MRPDESCSVENCSILGSLSASLSASLTLEPNASIGYSIVSIGTSLRCYIVPYVPTLLFRGASTTLLLSMSLDLRGFTSINTTSISSTKTSLGVLYYNSLSTLPPNIVFSN